MASGLIRAIRELDCLAEFVADTLAHVSPSKYVRDAQRILLDIITCCKKALGDTLKRVRSNRRRRRSVLHKFRQLALNK